MSACRHQPCDQPETVAHIHLGMILGYHHVLVYCDEPLAVVGDCTTAHRLAELINIHGLVDIPDPATFGNLWPPPDPDDRIIDHIRTDREWPDT